MLGPEMKSTGEVLGIAPSFHEAMMKGLVAAGYQFKTPGPGSCVIISVKDSDKAEAAELAWKLHDYGYKIYGTPGTAKFLNSEMVPCSVVRQMSGARPNVIDLLESGLVDYIISRVRMAATRTVTPSSSAARQRSCPSRPSRPWTLPASSSMPAR